ncbi:WhiB family transcriptional regulator [Streptomyces sp. NPDC059697]|uniref:WhiB family transcriptional regulator n=1 Tax=Streptomyces sp. NPDC059697 TaxID=3346912 RepID=UPI0036A8E08F
MVLRPLSPGPHPHIPSGEQGAEKQAREKKVRALCGRCPAIEACAWTSMSGPEPYGVWGGMSEGERRRLRQLRPRRVVAAESETPESE